MCSRSSTLALMLFGALLACADRPDASERLRPEPCPRPAQVHDDAANDQAQPELCARADRPGLCARPGADRVRDAFCVETAPEIHSLEELRRALGLDLSTSAEPPQHVFLAHSTALSGQLVSALNPRMIALTTEVQLAFQRGVQQVELATRDRASQSIKLYLLQFEQACNAAAHGCSAGQLYTPSVESDWTRLTLHDDEDLANTASDCRQCHQRALPEPILLMRELEGPWTHFFAPESSEAAEFPEPTGSDLLQDYLAAKGDEAYGGVPSQLMRKTSGFSLQIAVSSAQPLIFEGAVIAEERWPFRPGGYAARAERSPTWDAHYAAFKRGERLALPHYAARPSDRDKQAQLTAAYRSYRVGELHRDELPDLANIYPDDAHARAELGLQTEPDASPVELLIQACAPCHNDVLDQSISRARFTIALERMGERERQRAADRIQLPADAPGVMPPPGTRQLDEPGRARLLDYLRLSTRPAGDDAELRLAAAIGMSLPPDDRMQ